MRHWSDARLGAVAVIPGFDSSWFEQSAGARPIALLVGLAALAILALLVASAAYRNDRRRSRGIDDEELFTATPLPMPGDRGTRQRGVAPHHVYGAFKLPRWVQVGSLVVALGITWVVSQRLRPNNGPTAVAANTSDASGARAGAADRIRDDAQESPEDLDLAPDSAPDVSFRARDWTSSNGGCAGRLEVTKGRDADWSLTARVHDDQGRLIDSARTRVTTLRPGEVVEFHFERAECNRIGAWDVRAARRGR